MALRPCDGILEAVGSTPLVRLRRYLPDARFEVLAKIEALNPGGSIKDRPARHILDHAFRRGEIEAGTVVVESSSGNMGIGLAQACRYHGLRFICVVDVKTTPANLGVLRAYGAEIEMVTEPDPGTGELLQARLARVHQLRRELESTFWPNQYANERNSEAHYLTTMSEIDAALGGRLDILLVPTSTCGTIRGCGEYVRDHGLATRLIAVDAVGSQIFSDAKASRSIPGLGAGLRPPLCDLELVDDVVHVDDLECVVGCRRLVMREAILAGGSSGGVLSALEKLAPSIPERAVAALILPDRGERYVDTLFSDEWVRERFGAVDDLWRPEENGDLVAAARRGGHIGPAR